MKLKATLKFTNTYDRTIGRKRILGEEFETSETRAKMLIENGYAIEVKEKKKVKKDDSDREESDN